MLIVYRSPGHAGWGPINHMVRLAAEVCGADLLVVERGRSPTRLQRLAALWPRRRGAEACLVVCPHPRDLTSFLLAPGWRRRFSVLAAWIIDSFWTESLPRLARSVRLFDHLFVTTEEDIPRWEKLTGTATSHLPWGTDALRLGSARAHRSLDLLRVGRQPPEWDDDRVTEVASRALGIRFSGRPPSPPDERAAQPALMERYADSRYVLAFSNTVNPTAYTHPTREYLTGRWVDALAAGAVVAGVAPAAPDARRLLWPEATLEVGGVGRAEGLEVIASALRSWSPQRARTNHRNALERLDWRWRFQAIAARLGEDPPRLRAELEEIRGRVRELDGAAAVARGPR